MMYRTLPHSCVVDLNSFQIFRLVRLLFPPRSLDKHELPKKKSVRRVFLFTLSSDSLKLGLGIVKFCLRKVNSHGRALV